MGQIITINMILAVVTALLAGAAVVSAEHAMRTGLTYSAMRATLIVLVFVALAHLVHAFAEMLGFEFDKKIAFAQYGLYIIGYSAFVLLSINALKLRRPAPPSQGAGQNQKRQ